MLPSGASLQSKDAVCGEALRSRTTTDKRAGERPRNRSSGGVYFSQIDRRDVKGAPTGHREGRGGEVTEESPKFDD